MSTQAARSPSSPTTDTVTRRRPPVPFSIPEGAAHGPSTTHVPQQQQQLGAGPPSGVALYYCLHLEPCARLANTSSHKPILWIYNITQSQELPRSGSCLQRRRLHEPGAAIS